MKFTAYKITCTAGYIYSPYPDASKWANPRDSQLVILTCADSPDYRVVMDGPDGLTGQVIGFTRTDGGFDTLNQAIARGLVHQE